MKTLLRHTRTGLFFEGPERWTSDEAKAFDFRFMDRAFHYVNTWELKDEVELAFAFESSQSLTVVPLEKANLRFEAA